MLSPTLAFALLALTARVEAAGKANTFEIMGNTGVSAQQLFLGTQNKVYIVDKAENNPVTINGHPAWAVEWDLNTHDYRAMDIVTNSFCAGGIFLGNGTLLNAGGNNAVTTGGVSVSTLNIPEGGGSYADFSGGRAARLLTPCDDGTCNWSDDFDAMPLNRWYPSLESLPDGSAIILGRELWGGFVNSVNQMQSVPTAEFFPSRGAPVNITFLQDTQPANLYPLTWLMPDGSLFMQADWQTTLLDYTTLKEQRLPNITHAQKTYPASGAVAMLPLTPENQYDPTLLFCGGMKPERDDWDTTKWDIVNTPTSSSCVSINPMAKKPVWKNEQDLPENRGMGNFIILPDETLFLANGVSFGSAGYGTEKWVVGASYAKDPVLSPAIYNHSAPVGQRFSRTGMADSTIGRLYHSVATLLPDGSVFIAGSNPGPDVITEQNNASYPYKTEFRAERYYPSYYDATRPAPTGLPTSLSYGGSYFNVSLPASSMAGATPEDVRVIVVRTGFSTHAINFGMRSLTLNTTYTTYSDSSVTLHVPQMPPNAALFAPGPALIFVVVNGVPSQGQFVMVGSGTIEKQTIAKASTLPLKNLSGGSTAPAANSTSQGTGTAAAVRDTSSAGSLKVTGVAALVALGTAMVL